MLPIMYIVYMELSPKTSGRQCYRRFCAIAVPVVLCLVLVVVFFAGCGYRVSYNVRTVYADPLFSARSLSNADMAVLPLLTPRGALTEGPLEAGRMVKRLRSLRPDLRFVSYEEFEKAFPPRFDRRRISDFYGGLFRQEVLSIKNMDSLWVHIAQPFILVYALQDGAEIRNIDGSRFKHVTVSCEIWSREGREVVWRATVKGVSDDGRMADSELLAASMRFLAESIPVTAPEYGRERW
jgi:hypothetical protein